MKLASTALRNRTVCYFIAMLLLIGGVLSFFRLGQLEDPQFSIKNANIVTTYTGASPTEVELEVTDRIELAIQEMPEVDFIESFSNAGLSVVSVTIKAEFWGDRLPQIWDSLRRKMRDVQSSLPPSAGTPIVNDDFGDVFGFQLAVIGDGFSEAELDAYADRIKTELSLVDGVARVDLWGAQQRAIYLDVTQTQLSELGITGAQFISTLQVQNSVVDAGALDVGQRRLRIAPSGAFETPSDIANLSLSGAAGSAGDADALIRIRDIATVREGYVEPPSQLMRYNGAPAIGLSISNEPGVNIVDVGAALDLELQRLSADLPVGIEVQKVHWQGDVVSQAVDGFLESFAQAVMIVIVVIALIMGWRLGMIIGFALIFTILATFILMAILEINLQRISLGALVVALGMMVDNAIVVADGYVARRRRGIAPDRAATEAADIPAGPLFGATIVAVMAFYPIYGSTESVGEYCATLFLVIAISLIASWFVSMTLTPMTCIDFLKIDPAGDKEEAYSGGFYRRFRSFLEGALRARWLTLGVMVGMLAVSVVGFGQVRQLFFPESSMTKYMIDYWAPEGARIQTVSEDLRRAEARLLEQDQVESVASFIGSGPPRFYLPVEPEPQNASYGQLIVNVRSADDIPGLIAELQPWFDEAFPDALVTQRRFGVGPSNSWKVEVRLTGPANADPDLLRATAADIVDVFEAEPMAGAVRTDWRQRVQRLEPAYNQERAQWSSVTRSDVANATKLAFDGLQVGLYREGDELIPILVRYVDADRRNVAGVDVLPVEIPNTGASVPMAQVVDGVRTVWEDPTIRRRDRQRTITIQTNPILGVTAPALQAATAAKIEALELPPGFRLEWGGDHESSADANASLAPGLAPALAIMAIIVVALFNAFRPPLIILAIIPFALIGITAGLLAFDAAFGFVALLGAMSLAGMMIKNAIVLLDEINIERAAGRSPYDAVIEAALSRLRPVMLAAATTVLGVIPLLTDVFWVGLAVTIMGGLTVGAILTMIGVPLFYVLFFNVRSPEQPPAAPTAAAAAAA